MKHLLPLLFIVFSAFSPMKVQAQEATDSAQSAEQEAILQKQRLDEEIESLNTIYRGQLTEYRTAEKEFQIAQDQYRALQTLASINDVTESARKVMRIRVQVLLTYFELLRIRLIAAEGIELSLKEAVFPKIEAQKNWLQSHQQNIAAVSDREEFNTLSDGFTERTASFHATAQEAISLLSVGKLQNVYDRLSLLAADVAAQEASNSAIANSREMRETSRTAGEIQTSFQTVWNDLRQDVQDNNVASFYNSLSKTLNPVYADLNQLASFLGELLRAL